MYFMMDKKRKIKQKQKQRQTQTQKVSQKQNVTINLATPKRSKPQQSPQQPPKPSLPQIVMSQPYFPPQPPPTQQLYNPMVRPLYPENVVRNIDQQSPVFFDSTDNIPEAQAYRLPPMLPNIPLDPVRLENRSGKYNPFEPPIFPSSTPYGGNAYEEPLRDFEQTRSYNELVKNDQDKYDTNMARQQSLIDYYNLNLNSYPAENQDIPLPEAPIFPSSDQSQELTYEPERRSRGRPTQLLTDEDRRILELYVRASLVRASERSLSQQMEYQAGYALKQAKRRNPEIAITLRAIYEKLQDQGKSR